MLDKLPPAVDPRVLVSESSADDAGVFLMNDGTALVLTVDLFTPVVDDARDFGRISAANAVSDVYAMGGTPLVALNIVAFPDGEMPMSIMTDILAGGAEKMAEAGAPIVGGHSVSDRELKYGLAVVGTVHPDAVVTNAGARPGDVLALTKPLGTGVLSTALKHERLAPEGVLGLTDVMARLNREAAASMLEAGANAATDITGFGLIGHAMEMADAGGVTVRLDAGSVPLIDGALDALNDGMAPGGLALNRDYFGARVRASRSDGDPLLELLYDPQTSGGLLVSLLPERAEEFVSSLARRGGACAVVGRVTERGPVPVVVD